MLNELTVTVDSERALVTLVGEHEAFTAHKLARQLEGLLDDGMSIVVDLRRTEFVDSTVVAVLLTAKRQADELHREFLLLLGEQTGWPVRRLLEVTGLDATFGL